MQKNIWKKFELQIAAVISFIAISLSVSFYFLIYNQYFSLTIDSLKADAVIVHKYVESIIGENSFTELNTVEDESKEIYLTTHAQLDEIRKIANILYLYTAKMNENGDYIYVLDGLDRDAEDFRHVGDLIEEEIIPDLEKCLNNETVLGDNILVTEWGIVYVTYFPVHADDGSVIGAIGMEFDCENLYNSYNNVKIWTIALSVLLAAVFIFIAILILKRVVRNTEDILDKKDQLLIAAKEEALESSRAKSDFLSRMSHEIRTPMNAIIGMTAIADNTDDVGKIKYCLSTIRASSAQLLELINDILDMSKIEAGKFELELAPLNIEKILMKVCNLVIDKVEQRKQKFNINLSGKLRTRYIGDELRISQIVTNLLSNAVKFTPECGTIILDVDEVGREDDYSVLSFSVADNGIGMTEEQVDKLFQSFEQADGSISRKFGGTGLGLAISKNLIERMGGRIWVESEIGKGSVFHFEIRLERSVEQDEAIIFDGISPSDLYVLVVDDEEDVREHVMRVMGNSGIRTDMANNGDSAVQLVKNAMETRKPYDVIFLDYDLPGDKSMETAASLIKLIDKNTIIVMTSFLERDKIEKRANSLGINHFVSKPLFPSSLLDAINDIVGSTIKKLEMETPAGDEIPDFSELNLLLIEDIEINREIVIALLEESGINIDTAENGLEAIQKFKAAPEKYDLVFMDIQMPEMDGYEATKCMRAMDAERAKTIPIVAMTANAFKEDIEKCLECGMNDHIAKPINLTDVIEKITLYTGDNKK